MSPTKPTFLSPNHDTEAYSYKETPGLRGWIEEKTGEALLGIVTTIPPSVFPVSETPRKDSLELIQKACSAAAVQSGLLALPAGPLGIITILPDLMNIWRIQSQLIADIAALHGKNAYLGRQEMAWCLFRHAATQIARDFIVRAGQRALISQLSQKALTTVLRKVSVRSAERLSGRLLLRFIPLVGMGVAASYAWWDTRQVGRAAIELFGSPKV